MISRVSSGVGKAGEQGGQDAEARAKVESLLGMSYPLAFHIDFELWTLRMIDRSGETSGKSLMNCEKPAVHEEEEKGKAESRRWRLVSVVPHTWKVEVRRWIRSSRPV